MRGRHALPVCGLVLLCGAVPSHAASRLVVRGAGFGHGVGLSQFGAKGFAERGRSHEFILSHYYPGTRLGPAPGRDVSVLLQTAPRVSFSGATAADGVRGLNPATTYAITRAPSGKLTLRSPTGRRLGSTRDPLTLRGADAGIRLAGRSGHDVTDGSYRGELELRPAGGGISVVNVVDLEDYVRGVVAGESPSGWPMAALRAQAIVARTYAVTTSKAGPGFEQYPDTRSQVYNGIAGERPRTDRAVLDTGGDVVTYRGAPVVTYYFSTSGGRTENVENVFEDAAPQPWLRSVSDPYDRASPKHKWVARMSLARAQRRLGGLVKGRLRTIRVLDRGRSPRVVRAQIVGSAGRTAVSGATLRRRLRLLDSWATFTLITAERARPAAVGRPVAVAPTGGALPRFVARASQLRYAGALRGRVAPARANRWVAIQRRAAGRWQTLFESPTGAGGRYEARLRRPGVYRVQYRREHGPAVRVR